MKLLTSLFFSLSMIAVSAIDEVCTPSPSIGPGPLYSGNREESSVICDNDFSNPNSTKVATSLYWRTSREGANSLIFSGKILNDKCQPIPNAIVDVWQTNSQGKYSSLDTSTQGSCRGYVMTDQHGSFSFETHIPGTYGLQFGNSGPIKGLDFPLWGPRHIHVAVAAEGYELLSTEIHFQDDPLLTNDFRGWAEPRTAPFTVDSSSREIEVDFILKSAETPESVEISRKSIIEQIRDGYCEGYETDPELPFYVCDPESYGTRNSPLENVALAVFSFMVALVVVALGTTLSLVRKHMLKSSKKVKQM